MDDSEKMKVCQRVDALVAHMAALAVNEIGAPVPLVVDRILTFGAAQAVAIEGAGRTADVFRDLADEIEAGLFAGVVAASRNAEKRH